MLGRAGGARGSQGERSREEEPAYPEKILEARLLESRIELVERDGTVVGSPDQLANPLDDLGRLIGVVFGDQLDQHI